MRSAQLSLLFSMLGLFWSSHAEALEYRPTALNLLPGYAAAAANAINDSGQIVGWMSPSISFDDRTAVVWNPDGSIRQLAELADAVSINDAGQVAGHCAMPPDGWERGVLWNPDGTAEVLLPLGEDVSSYACGMNNSGQVVGFSRDNGTESSGTLWTEAGVTQLPLTQAMDINDAGQIVGWTGSFLAGSRATLLNQDGGNIDLGIAESYATALNSSGVVVGTFWDDTMSPWAFMWQASTGPITLSALPGDIWAEARDINDAGQVVAVCYDSIGLHYHGVLWDWDGRAVELNPLPGHSESGVWGINNQGIAVGYSDGVAVVWTPVPELSNSIALLTGLVGLALARRRKQL